MAAVHNLLEDLGVGHQTRPVEQKPIEQLVGTRLVRVSGADKVHRNVGVEEDRHQGNS